MSAAATKPMKLRVGRVVVEVADLTEASRRYQQVRDERLRNGDHPHSIPQGRVGKFWISFNGRVWDGDRLVQEATV